MSNTKEHIRSPNVSFDTINYAEPEQLRLAQESMLREQLVRVAALKVVRKALEKCYAVTAPNHYEDCREIAEKYMDMLPNHRVQGYLGYQKNDPSK
ncbi:hypothetical protein PACTADRAFT_48499 [Pachysolen tannophilus NRRL Y-2460]|uniref:NADH-ubiquinone oxidoreductase 12 kDa subunit n=1 Tax=Pachysolen tannophilus NRRL Y-2460 TaxID=669874 RepID=A0A1E4TY47_PACTA|nr:hypothetical protein PACTADRAFT_48499 [Pachysolen tannophilus NRRL Y-2460]